MTLNDYLIDIALIAVVLLQVRGRRLTTRSMLLPVLLVGLAAHSYLHSIPTAGNDLVLVIGCTAVGAILGGLCALATSLKRDGEGFVIAKAGFVAAALWILGVGTRFAFQLYASHGGGPALERFSASHDITSPAAWTAALVLMAIGEVLLRTGVIAWRAYTAHGGFSPATRVGSGRPLDRAIIGDSGRSF
jgi:hypothetical protein